mgnify:CR=1 FL=1
MKGAKTPKAYGIGIEIEILGRASASGFTDINDYIRYLEELVAKKQAQVEALQSELLQAKEANEAPK